MKKVCSISENNFSLYVANIKACYYQALQYPTIVEAGINWYADKNLEASKIAKRYCTNTSLVLGVIAALSPRNKWHRNLIDCELVFKAIRDGRKPDQVSCCTFDHNKEKAFLIARGFEPLEVLRGNKVIDFYKCLLTPTDPFTVCVDGHAANIAIADQAPSLSDKNYSLLADAYRVATKQISNESLEGSILPLQCQSLTWTYYRVIRGIDTSLSI